MPDGPELKLEKEIRFALVMYGGVSLAVYINGVAQEFYRLVRATADDGSNSGKPLEVSGEDKVYRKIAQILSASGVDRNLADPANYNENLPIRTRFIVDILSGTSAGGLNSLFLAKALANREDFTILQDLWLNQADVAALLNDSRSTKNPPSGFSRSKQNPPQSLLDSERMYALLLGALDEMDRRQTKGQRPLVDEVDLFITATDLHGVEVQVQLADKPVAERRYRSVFHFRSSPVLPQLDPPGEAGGGQHEGPPPRNDFLRKFNPFLAFTGRCTSAFPVAFEPMRLKDIEPVLERSSEWRNAGVKSTSCDWQPFLVDYVDEDGSLDNNLNDFPARAFADGGYLNNKPFSYAIEELGVRGGDLPYERKLVYIEPSPELLDGEAVANQKPDFIANSLAAAFTLPRYQTIREDLARVSSRNRLVRKIKHVVEEVENDIDANICAAWVPIEAHEYRKTPLKKLVETRGILYAAYHRLKVKAVTQEIARFLMCALTLDDSSDELRAAYYLVWAWRKRAFTSEGDPETELESSFLSRYDISYRERRMYSILGRLDALYALGKDAERVVMRAGLKLETLQEKHSQPEAFRSQIRELRGNRKPGSKTGLVNMQSNFRICRNKWLERGTDNPLHGVVAPYREKWKASLQRVLTASSEECLSAADKELEDGVLLGNLKAAMELMAQKNNECFGPCAQWANELFPVGNKDLLRHCVRYFYDHYDLYDAATFPISYGTDIGILKTADVYRISPVDATAVVDESTDPKNRKKLAGNSIFAFGAFFQDAWRENDIMWGRLDGAERIISILLPGAENCKLREGLIAEAHTAIIEATLHKSNRTRFQSAVLKQIANADTDAKQTAALALLTPAELLAYLKKNDTVDRGYKPDWAIPIAARASKIAGQLLTFISDERHWKVSAIPAAVRFSRLAWAVVQVAIPGSIAYADFIWLAGLLLFTEATLFGLGIVFRSEAVSSVAAMALAITLIGGVAIQLLHNYMRSEQGLFLWLRTLFTAACIFVGLTVTVVGIYDLPEKVRHLPLLLRSMPLHGLALHTAITLSSASLIIFGLLCQLPRFSKNSRLSVPANLREPTLAIELCKESEEVREILSTPSDRWSMRLVQLFDFGVIAGYAAFFTAVAVYEVSRLQGYMRLFPIGAIVFGFVTATFDILENLSILRTLDLPASVITKELVEATRKLSLTKWSFLAGTFLLLAPGLLSQSRILPAAAGVLFASASLTGVIGLFFPKWIRTSMALFAVLVLGFLLAALAGSSIAPLDVDWRAATGGAMTYLK